MNSSNPVTSTRLTGPRQGGLKQRPIISIRAVEWAPTLHQVRV
jgi:hypothetical protein